MAAGTLSIGDIFLISLLLSFLLLLLLIFQGFGHRPSEPATLSQIRPL